MGHENAKSVPVQRGARFVLLRSVPMQRGARFLIFGERSMVQHGVDEGVKNIYKTNVSRTTWGTPPPPPPSLACLEEGGGWHIVLESLLSFFVIKL